uniref:Uncharacterized protein n=1 Tax=Anopheles farauti TaxID=69004 RepID=A0A182QJX9_9DIPT
MMNNFTGFSDLCIPVAPVAKLNPIIKEAIELGFRNVAIEQNLEILKGGSSSKLQDAVPVAFCLKELKIMTCDIITYNSDTIRMRLSRKFYYLAIERNIAFELKYAPAILNSSERKSTIYRAHRYHSYGKSKNVIISSGASNAFQLRSPYDIANLGLIFGLSEEQSKEAIRGVPNRILLSAEGRRLGKAGVVIARLGPKDTRGDSDDYSDSEVEEDISDNQEEDQEDVDMEDDNGTEGAEDTEVLDPPKKMAKHN